MSKNEIYLYGSVGYSWWEEDYFTAKTVRDAIAGMAGPLTVRINSGGGLAMEGQAIYTLLSDYAGPVDVIVDGVAASAASLIAMAGDTITMRLGSYLLIHDAASGWTDGRGTEEDHRRAAEQLDVVSGALADIYAARAGITRDAAREVMRAETFMDGPAAVAGGFATAYDGAVQSATAAVFDYRIYANAPTELVLAAKNLARESSNEAVKAIMKSGHARPTPNAKQKEVPMPKITASGAAAENEPAVQSQDHQPAAVNEGAESTAATMTAERDRAARITAAVMMAGQPAQLAHDLIVGGKTAEVAIDEITNNWKKGGDVDNPSHGRATAVMGLDAREKFKTGAALALMAKTGVSGGERNEFSSMSLSELARASIEVSGSRAQFSDKMSMVGHAFTMQGTHTTSDFAEILSNVAAKAALIGWAEAEETFEAWTTRGVLTDFKASKRVDIGLLASLPEVKEGADYKFGTVGDRGESIALASYGQLLKISRQAIINDDLDILGKLPLRAGRAAKVTIGNLVYAILTGNPVMSDGVALFDAAHKNLAVTAAALSVASIGAGRAAMRVQKENEKGTALNITPRYLIVPAALELAAQQLIASAVDPTTGKGLAQNPIANSMAVITDARLDAGSATAWFMAANAGAFDTIEVAYLDGNAEPFIEQKDAWNSDGVEMKVRIDAGVKALDHRGLYKNAGA